MNNRRDKKGWPTVFRRGRALYAGLRQAFAWIELEAAGGGGFRPLYAEFLHEAARVLLRPGLAELAEDYRRLGARWTALAEAMLPAEVPALAETRKLLHKKQALLHKLGPHAAPDVIALGRRLEEIAASAATDFPLPEQAVDALYADLEHRVLDIHAREVAAAARLEALLS